MASKTYETPPPSPGLDPTFSNQPVPPDAVRMVGIRKTAGEHLVREQGRARGGVCRGRLRVTSGGQTRQERAEDEDGISFAQGPARADPGDRRHCAVSCKHTCARTLFIPPTFPP